MSEKPRNVLKLREKEENDLKICDDAAPGRIIQKARKFSALSLTVPYDAGLARLSSASVAVVGFVAFFY